MLPNPIYAFCWDCCADVVGQSWADIVDEPSEQVAKLDGMSP